MSKTLVEQPESYYYYNTAHLLKETPDEHLNEKIAFNI